jgi:hypothetical protein
LETEKYLKVAHILVAVPAIYTLTARDTRRQHNSVALRNAVNLGSDFNHIASDVRAEDVREWLNLRPVSSRPNIKVIHGAGLHSDQDFRCVNNRGGNGFVAEFINSALFVENNRFHNLQILFQSGLS